MPSFPPALVHLAPVRTWIGWRWGRPKGAKDSTKLTKIPCDAGGRAISSADPANLRTYTDLWDALTHRVIDGVALASIGNDGSRIVLDLDKCRDPATGALSPQALAVVNACGSYTEVSPSGTGLRIIGGSEGWDPAETQRRWEAAGLRGETFFSTGFATITFQALPGHEGLWMPIGGLAAGLPRRSKKKPSAVFDGEIAVEADPAAPVDVVRETLAAIPNTEGDWERWNAIGMRVFRATSGSDDGLQAWLEWSVRYDGYGESDTCEDRWEHWRRSSPPTHGGYGTLHWMAAQATPGWTGGSLWKAWRARPQPGEGMGALPEAGDGVSRFPAQEEAEAPGGTGATKTNLANTLHLLRTREELAGLVAYDEMARREILMRPVPGAQGGAGGECPRPLTDIDALAVQEYIQRIGFHGVKTETVNQALAVHAAERSFHPVREWLNGLRWDGVPRLRTWLHDSLGVEDTPYSARVGEMFLIAMVARILRPGCKADHMLVLMGPQGSLKSSACAVLADRWFSDSLPAGIDSRDASAHMRDRWLIELAELAHVRASESDTLKKFITRREERYRPSYGRREVVEPRQCLFVGTTNEDEFLKDPTGNRRFWPVQVGRIDLDRLRADRASLFAEAVALFKSGANWWPEAEFEETEVAPVQSAAREEDAWIPIVHRWWTTPGPMAPSVKAYTITDVLRDALHIDLHRLGRTEQNRMRAVLQRLGWKPRKRTAEGRLWDPPALSAVVVDINSHRTLP